jgi:hypothetical protein
MRVISRVGRLGSIGLLMGASITANASFSQASPSKPDSIAKSTLVVGSTQRMFEKGQGERENKAFSHRGGLSKHPLRNLDKEKGF